MSAETWHGTSGGYTNHRCRCDACAAAWRERMRDYMASHPEQRDKRNARGRRWSKQNRPRANASARVRYQAAMATPEGREKLRLKAARGNAATGAERQRRYRQRRTETAQ